MQTKEEIFEDFKVEKLKDKKLSNFKKYKGKEQFVNRIKYLQDHSVAKEEQPNAYKHLSINFKNLIKMYESGDPDQYCWDKLGIVPWHIQQEREKQKTKDEKKYNTIN